MELTKKEHVPGVAIAVISDSKLAWAQCIGYADVASRKPVTVETIFNIGSISKMVSAWGFMQLNPRKLNKVLQPQTIQLMEQPVLPFSNEGESGLGYQFMNYEGFRTIGHTGENVGWSAAMFIDLPTKSAIVILCNGSNGDHVWYPIYQRWIKTVN